MGADLQEDGGALSRFGCLGQDADGAIGLETVDEARARTAGDTEPFRPDGDAAIRSDLEEGAHTPDVGPPATARHGAQQRAFFAPSGEQGGVGGAAQFAMDFVGVAMVSAAKSAGSRPCQY